MVYTLFNRKSKTNKAKVNAKTGINSENQQLAEKLHKSIIRKLKKHKVYSSFRDNIQDADLDCMKLIRMYDKEIRLLLYVIDIISKNS